jgi:hypothetical protein
VFTVVAGLQAVLTAFVLISVFDAADSARQGATQEADDLVAVYWDADLMPQAAREQIQKLSLSYASTVADSEWPAMSRGRPVPETGKEDLDRIHDAIAGIKPADFSEEDRQTQINTDLSNVYQARQTRLDAASTSVNPIVWMALILGGALSVALTCLFGGEKLRTHVIVAGILAGTVTVLLFATYQLQNPFGGAVHVGPDAFDAAMSQFS